MTNPIEPPKQTRIDNAIAIAKAAIGAVHPVAGVAAEAFSLVVATPYQRRHAEWMESVGAKLVELEDKHAGIHDRLQNDPGFIDTLLQATQAAIRSSDGEKRTALRNAVLNSATADRPDDSRRQMFVNLIDEFTPWHLRLLALAANPVRWYELRVRQPRGQEGTGSFDAIFPDAFPELKDEQEFREQVIEDLIRRGCLFSEAGRQVMFAEGSLRPRITRFGSQFLEFISEPASLT